MPDELDPHYDHQKTEAKIYELWEKSGFFNPDNLPSPKSKILNPKSFSIIMPPPNANGSMHLGHAVFVTLQDILIRFARMQGKRTLWLPGADHAGFETQVVFDKKLDKEGRNRFEMDREELWQEIWDFTQKNKAVMENQLRKLGASADWSREKFTLDPDIVKIVYETFEKLYDDGLAYRDLRVVNWCPKHKTALSDLEVKYIERTDPLYYISYGPLSVATVRPETKFGDTALAVNPKDKRYAKYVGKEVEIEDVLGPKKLKVVADDAVDPKFGTGVVKVTPAHDQTDFEIWQRHKNEIDGPKVVIDENGRLTGDIGEYKGLKVAEAREKVVERMKELGILEKIDPIYVHQVATCYKCGSTLEPLPKPQWFIKTQPLAKKAITVATTGKIKFFPESSKKIYLHWLKNIRDWNISRQIVWGIRIPAWFCLGCGEPKINAEIKSKWFIVRHGETNFNKPDSQLKIHKVDEPLNETGIAQIKKVAEQLKNHTIDIIISSDFARARMSAEIISKVTGAKVIFDKGLRERDFGELRTLGQGPYPAEAHSYEWRIPGGESFKDVEERAWESFISHKINHHHKNIVIVSHGGTIKTLIKKLRGWDHARMLEHKTKNAELFKLDIIKEKCTSCGGDMYEQDPDVFDTWFSSGQWPFAALMSSLKSLPTGRQEKLKNQKSKLNDDFKEFYPTDVMETGYDILFFWVARMVMLSLYRTGKIPFKNVYLHGLVRDKDRQKMSKSKGNVIDPLGIAEIYGADALRMALVVGNTAGNDIIISEEKIRGYRNFATKIWNVARFITMNKPHGKTASKPTAEDKKHLAALGKIKAEVTKHIEKFEFHLAAETLYHYFWHTFADKIIESAKPRLQGENEEEKNAAYQTLETILLECLKMLHPFMPFITEEIYRKFKPEKMLMVEKW